MFVRYRHYTLLAVIVAALSVLAYAESPQLVIGVPTGATIPTHADIRAQSVTGGDTAQCTVTLSQVVQGQDQIVNVETDHPEVFTGLPETVVVPVGYDSVTFTLYTVPVSGQITATLTFSCNGGQVQGTLTVNP